MNCAKKIVDIIVSSAWNYCTKDANHSVSGQYSVADGQRMSIINRHWLESCGTKCYHEDQDWWRRACSRCECRCV